MSIFIVVTSCIVRIYVAYHLYQCLY